MVDKTSCQFLQQETIENQLLFLTVKFMGKKIKLSVLAAGNNRSYIIIYVFGSIDYIYAFTVAITDSFSFIFIF